ncbi:MAG: phosphatase PAP2 family protein [Candidatus Paceibacterota bacterium]
MPVLSPPENTASSGAQGWTWARESAAWRAWWRAAPRRRRLGPGLGVFAFWVAHLGLGGFRGDHVALGLAVLAVAYAGPRAAPWFRLLLPLALMGAVYDGQGYVRRALGDRLTVHIAEPADFDRALFGVKTAAGVLTPPEWLQLHTHPVLDVVCSLTYLGFVPVFIGAALWFHWRGRRTPGGPGERRVQEAEAMTWAFFWLGLVSVVTYYLYAAAPPWYAAKYGWGPVVHDALPDAGGAARVDAMLGLPVFATFYGRNPNAFGAIPSLHAAIPLLAFCFACRAGSLRVFTGLYTLLMMFAAVYLNHHYVIDLLWGAAYALLIAWLMLARRRP